MGDVLLDRLTVNPGGSHTLDDDDAADLDEEGMEADDTPSPYMAGAAPPLLSDGMPSGTALPWWKSWRAVRTASSTSIPTAWGR